MMRPKLTWLGGHAASLVAQHHVIVIPLDYKVLYCTVQCSTVYNQSPPRLVSVSAYPVRRGVAW
jgi:hypothetical protein